VIQIHLSKKGMSQRGVRYEVLSMSDIDAADLAAGRECTKDSLQSEFLSKSQRYGMEMMVREVTEKPCTPEELQAAKWKPVNAEYLRDNWSKHFNLKDTIALKAIFRKEHSLTEDEVNEIMGKQVELIAE
jgi:hypothetical protein